MTVLAESVRTTDWASDAASVRQGMMTVCGRTVEYHVMQPAPTQWVIVALVSCRTGSPRQLVVTEGRDEIEALARLEHQLRQFGEPFADSAFATEWAMEPYG